MHLFSFILVGNEKLLPTSIADLPGIFPSLMATQAPPDDPFASLASLSDVCIDCVGPCDGGRAYHVSSLAQEVRLNSLFIELLNDKRPKSGLVSQNS